MSDFRHSPSGGAFVRICGKVETVLGFVAGHLLAVGAFRQTGAFTGAGTAGACPKRSRALETKNKLGLPL